MSSNIACHCNKTSENICKMYESEYDYGLDNVHNMLIKGLTYFDNLCRKYDIKYSLHGGALLGAERNHKLIPWDDDLDISMDRGEYKRLLEVISEINPYCQFNITSTWLPRIVVTENNQIAFIDIFIWDYITESRIGQKIKITLLRFLQGMMKRHIKYERFNFVYRICLHTTHNLGRLFSWEAKIRWFQYISEHCFTGNKRLVHRSNDSFQGVSHVFDKDYIKDYVNIKLENKTFMANKRYKELLVRSYGEDYLTPPPISERVTKHVIDVGH